MLKRIAIKGFKSLVDVQLDLPRLVVLAGPNAAGKSNFLDALQMFARTATQRTLADALAPPIRGFPVESFTLPPGGLPQMLEQPVARFSLEGDLAVNTANGPDDRVRYRVGVEIDPDAGALRLSDEYLARLTKSWEPRDLPRIEVKDGELILRRSGGGGRPPHEQLGANHTLASDSRLSGSSYPLFDVLRDELRLWRTYYLDPQTAMRAEAAPREVGDIGVRGEYLAPFLHGLKLRRPKHWAAVQRAVKAIVPAVDDLDVDLDPKRGTLDIQVSQGGTTFSSRVASEGTLRVLALCAIAVTAERGLFAFEEPENGVQPQRLERIADLLTSSARRGGAQIIVTTHSPGFAAAMLERSSDPAEIGIFTVGREGHESAIRRLDERHHGLWSDQVLEEVLREPDRNDKISALISRGWLDL